MRHRRGITHRCLQGGSGPYREGSPTGDAGHGPPAARVRWLEHTVEGLVHEVTSIRAQLRALVQPPPALDGADQALADLLQRQLETMEHQCALVRTHLAAFREEVTGGPPAGASTAAPMEEPDEGHRSGGPDVA